MDYEEEFHNLAATEIPLTIYDLNRTRIQSQAVFIDGTYEFAADWYLTLGLRYSQEKAESKVEGHYIAGDIDEWDEDWKSTTPRIVVRHQLDEDSSIYASYSQGFKAGMLQPSAPSTTPIDQEEIDAFEVGYKTNRGTFRFDASAYYYDYQDLQVASFNGTQALVVNAGGSEIYGADFQFTSAISEALEFSLGVAYTHARYENFTESQPRDLEMGPSFLQIVNGVDADGNQMMRSPDWSGTASLTYHMPLADGELRLNGNLTYSDEFYFDANEQFKQDAYTLLNVRATWVSPSEAFSVAVYGTNVTDEEYISAILPGDQAIERGYGEPASYGVTVGYKY
jgi:iron complex outermembrane receptor protein